MSDAAHQARRSRKLMGVVLAAVVALVVPAVAVAAPPEGKGPSAPSVGTATRILIGEVLDQQAGSGLPDTPGTTGLAYVVVDREFSVSVSFLDATDSTAPLSDNKDVPIALIIDGVVKASGTVPAGETAWVFEDVVIETPGSGLRMVVRADLKPKAISSSTRTFDVLIADEPVNSNSRTSIGGATGSEGCDPIAPDALIPGKSVCADLLPPSGGAFAAGGTLSQGVCESDCADSYIQALVAFGFDRSNPSTLVMKCDKDECGVGPLRRQILLVNLSPEADQDDPLNEDVRAQACPAKGVVGLDQRFCVDYVQSTRSNAGDTILYLLFVVDAKVRFS